MKSLLLLSIVLLSPQEANEAEKLFRKMEEKLLAAKTLQLSFSIDMLGGRMKLTGDLLADSKNQFRHESEASGAGLKEKARALSVSDGRTVAIQTEPGAWKRFAAPETVGSFLRIGIARHGVLDATTQSGYESDLKEGADKTFFASDFRLGKKEKVGERETQQVVYRIGRGSWKDPGAIVWIDVKTHLPVKRSYVMEFGPVVETYENLKIDEKIDASKFELPK